MTGNLSHSLFSTASTSSRPLTNIRLKPLFIIRHISIRPPRLRNQKDRNNRAQGVAHEKDPQDVRQADYRRPA